MARKSKLSKDGKVQLSNLFNTLASAWFIAGIITPLFTSNTFSIALIYRGIVSLLAGIFFINLSILFTRASN